MSARPDYVLLLGLFAVGASLALSAGALSAPSGEPQLVHRFLDIRISPDGTRVASVEGDAPPGGSYPDVRELVIRRAADAVAVRVALPCGAVPQCWPGSPAWTPDGRHLSFTVRTPESHSYALYSVAADGGEPTKLLEFHGTLTDLKYAPDGTLAMLAIENARKEVGATEAGAPVAGDLAAAPAEQRIATLAGTTLHWASPPDLFVYEYDWRPGQAGFVGTAAPGDGDNNWWTAKLYAFAPQDGAAHVLYTPATAQQQLAEPRVSPDGRTVSFIAGLMSDFGSTGGEVYSLALESDAVHILTPGIKATATALEWNCDGALLVRLLASDRSQIVSLGPGRAAVQPQVLWTGMDTQGGKDAGGSVACPSGTHALAHESFTAAPEIAVGPVGQWRDLTRVNRGLKLLAEVRSITWSNDGFSVQGWLLLPPGRAGKVPLITIVHGGPAAATVPHFDGPGLHSRMLQRGWALFLPNPRGSFGQGERFTTANVRDFGYGDLRDILAGIDATERAAPVDEARLGLTGHS